MRLALLFGSLTLAFLLSVWTTQVPKPRPADAPAAAFSAARAMTDIEQIARAPHPVGSAEHARVRAYLTARMTQSGLSPQEQIGPLSPGAIQRLKRAGGDPEAANNQAINLIGVLPGKDRSQPAVMLMAHYDTVVGSPGAADDSTGVGAVLEAVRLLVLLFLRPLSPPVSATRPVLIGAATCLFLACGLSLAARFVEPTPAVAEALP